SLRRHLAEEDTSFAEVLDRLRNRLALRYLQDERVSLQQTAWLLGYSEIGAFNHAFKRWTGTSLGRARTAAPMASAPRCRLFYENHGAVETVLALIDSDGVVIPGRPNVARLVPPSWTEQHIGRQRANNGGAVSKSGRSLASAGGQRNDRANSSPSS